MKHFLFYRLIILGLSMYTSILYGQKIDFTIRYQTTDATYEVYALPDFNEADFFIGGGSQISILLPSAVDNAPLIVTSVNGGPWYDNSQVYTPAIASTTDFHGIASNGSKIDLVAGKEILLFTFELPEIECIQGIRLFNNPSDPNAQVPSMNGADFKNFFVNVFSFTDHYKENYNNEGTTCSTPTIVIPPISTPTDSVNTTCGTVLDENKLDIHTINICDPPQNGSLTIDLDNQTKEFCLEFTPNPGFIGFDSVCLEVCDQLGLCRMLIVPIEVYCKIYPTPIVTANNIACPNEQVQLETSNLGDNLTYFWTDGNGKIIGTGLSIEFPSEDLIKFNPIQVNIKDKNCPSISSLVTDIELVDFSNFIALNSGPVCKGGSVVLTANGHPDANYFWYADTSSELLAIGANPNIDQIEKNTIYKLVVEYKGCQNPDTLQTTVLVQDAPIIGNIPRSLTVCPGTDVSIIPVNENPQGQEIVYTWKGPNDFIYKNTTKSDSFGVFIPNITSGQSGAYSIDLTTLSGCNVDSRSIFIDVQASREPPILHASITEACLGQDVTLTATVQDDAEVIFEWFFQQENQPPSLFATTNHTAFLLESIESINAGNYLVRTVKDGCISGFSNTEVIQIAPNTTTVESNNNGPICEGEPVQLSATEIPNAVYNWYNANTNELVIAGNNPTLTNIQETTTFELRVVGNNCHEEIISQTTVVVQPKPTISNLSESVSYCQGETATINAQSTLNDGQILQYIWIGPNEFSFTNTTTIGSFKLEIPNLTADQAGAYNLEILTENGCAAIVQSILIEVNDYLETPMLTVDTATVCQNQPVELHATVQDDAALTFEWFIQTENEVIEQIATTSHPTFLLETINAGNEGNYLVRIRKNDCFSGFSNTLTISMADTITSVETSNSGPICDGESVQLSATEIPGAIYNWYLATTGELVATGNHPIVENIKENTTFELRMVGTSCQEMLTSQTEVLVSPTLEIINLNPIISVCNGADAVLNAANANPLGEEIQYIWSGPNNFESSAMTTKDSFNLFLPSITTTQAGTYTLQMESANSCSAFVGTVQVNVITAVEPPQLIVNQNLICSGSELNLQATISPQTNTTFEWYLQRINEPLFLLAITEIPIFSIANPTPANTGDYFVKIVNSDCASGFSNPQKITVLDPSQPIIATNTSTENSEICAGDFVQLNVPFFEGARYQWFGPGNYQSTQHNPFIDNLTPSMAGDYFAVINIPDCESIFSTSTTVTVRPKFPSPSLSSNTPLCLGENITLEVVSFLNFTEADTVNYQWFKAGTNAMLGETNLPQFIIENATIADAGDYYLLPFINGCVGDTSSIVTVTINVRPTLIADAGMDKKLCAAGRVFLTANTQEFATGKWSSTTGAIFEHIDSANTIATNLIAGDNHFIWSLQNDCSQTSKDTLTINIREVTTDIAMAGENRSICNPDDFQLKARPLINAKGTWYQPIQQAQAGIQIVNPNASTINVLGLKPAKEYQFTWMVSNENCENYDSSSIVIRVNDLPEEIAYILNADETQMLCEGTNFNLAAETPLFSIGKWSTTGDAIIVQPSAPETISDELSLGINPFIWSLSTSDCPNFSTDTLLIYKDELLMANPDNYTVALNDSLLFNVFENDVISDFENTTFIITKYPDNGTLREASDGTITYIPQRNFFGADNFRYKLCNNFCKENCDTTTVNLLTSGIDNASGICFIPNVISPNGDGVNDKFLIGCLEEFPDASIKIFNRWGDVLYEAAPYSNDWEGTYNQQPLPAGTYFYQLKLTAESKAIQDFITVFR